MISYCVTTVPERRHTTLPQTLSSLADAGFDTPILFVDGDPSDAEYGDLELPVAFRELEGYKIHAFGNFVLACWEMLLRYPQSEYYFMFQDDVELAFTLDWFLDEAPKHGSKVFWNFFTNRYTWAKRHKNLESGEVDTKPEIGWGASGQRGMGALAYCFTNLAMRKLTSSPRIYEHCLDQTFMHRNIDSVVAQSMKDAGITEMCHMPSLANHIGEESEIGRWNKNHGNCDGADPWWGVNWQDKLTSRSGDDAGIRDQLPESGAVSPRDAEVAV